MALIEIDALPVFTVPKHGGSFNGYVSHNQRVYIYIYHSYWSLFAENHVFGC